MCHISVEELTNILPSVGPATLSLRGPVEGWEKVMFDNTRKCVRSRISCCQRGRDQILYPQSSGQDDLAISVWTEWFRHFPRMGEVYYGW